jgi:hypothetical protein
MQKGILSIAAFSLLLGVGFAANAAPRTLSDGQLDSVTAGATFAAFQTLGAGSATSLAIGNVATGSVSVTPVLGGGYLSISTSSSRS